MERSKCIYYMYRMFPATKLYIRNNKTNGNTYPGILE